MHKRWIVAGSFSLVLAMGCTTGGPVTAELNRRDESAAGTAAPRAAERATLAAVGVRWARVASGLSAPTEVTSAPDGSRRLFVVEKGGTVRIVKDGHVRSRPYLDIGGRVDDDGEGGLLSVAFGPRFPRDGLLWLTYVNRAGDVVVGRMRAAGPEASRVPTRTLRTLLTVPHKAFENHFGGQLAFDAQRRMYVGLGDGGGGGDPFNAAGDRTDLRGKVLRIDPYGSCGARRYCVPRSNPFVGKRGRDEIWLMGLRNPWRFSIDPRTQNLWIGDVGQDAWEEIDRVAPDPRRIHLGWSCKEGRATYNPSRCRASIDYLGPRVVVPQPRAQSITGGFVYRGQRYQRQIGGAYVFGDFVTSRVWLYRAGSGKVLQDDRLVGGVTSFGVDDRGEIYAVTIDGTLWRMRVVRD